MTIKLQRLDSIWLVAKSLTLTDRCSEESEPFNGISLSPLVKSKAKISKAADVLYGKEHNIFNK